MIWIFLTILGSFSIVSAQRNLRCQPLIARSCQDLGYRRTTHFKMTQFGVQSEIENYLHMIGETCSPYTRAFLCYSLLPRCNAGLTKEITPCKSVCRKIRRDCVVRNEFSEVVWPRILDCEKFPTKEDGRCFSIQDFRRIRRYQNQRSTKRPTIKTTEITTPVPNTTPATVSYTRLVKPKITQERTTPTTKHTTQKSIKTRKTTPKPTKSTIPKTTTSLTKPTTQKPTKPTTYSSPTTRRTTTQRSRRRFFPRRRPRTTPRYKPTKPPRTTAITELRERTTIPTTDSLKTTTYWLNRFNDSYIQWLNNTYLGDLDLPWLPKQQPQEYTDDWNITHYYKNWGQQRTTTPWYYRMYLRTTTIPAPVPRVARIPFRNRLPNPGRQARLPYIQRTTSVTARQVEENREELMINDDFIMTPAYMETENGTMVDVNKTSDALTLYMNKLRDYVKSRFKFF